MQRSPQHRRRGFSLIEMTMVIVVVSVAAVPLLGSLAQPGRALLLAEDLQVATNDAQACADFVVRSFHEGQTPYAGIVPAVCSSLPFPSGNPPIVTIQDFVNATFPACPPSAACKKIAVNVTKNGTLLASLTFMITNYK